MALADYKAVEGHATALRGISRADEFLNFRRDEEYQFQARVFQRSATRRHLGPLIEHDSARKGALVATLRAYLETGEQQQAAHRLRVHPNTLRYRLDRIREITGLDLEDPETRLNLSVALRVQSLLGM